MAQVLVLHHDDDGGLHESQAVASSVYSLLLMVLCPLILLLLKSAILRFATTTTSTSTSAGKLLNKLPSPPWKLPVIGHLHHLVGSLPHVTLRDLARKHGHDGLMLLHLGAVPTLIVSSPRAAQAVLRTHDHVFASRPYSAVTDILFYGSSDVAFSPYGEYWRQVKKISTTHLLTVKKVRSYCRARQQEVRLVMAKIGEAAAARTAVDLSDLLNSFTNDIVCHAVSGKFFRDEGRNKLFRELVEANSMLLGGFNLEDYFPSLGRMDVVRRVVCAKAEKVKKKWDELLDRLIDDHATKPQQHLHSDEERDFIDVLLSVQQEYSLTRDNIKAILVVMFEGGTDTSFIVLEYAVVELIQKPQLMAKLQAEVRGSVPKGKEIVTEDDLMISGMAYLKAVIKETLRLHLPGPLLVPHLSMADCDVEGYTVPSGTRVIVNGWALGRDASYWESAEEFAPERFMEGGSSAGVEYKGNDFHFLPFGTGRRICPGINFAIATVEIMLANLMYHFDWELPEAGSVIDMAESFGLTLHRKEKLLLVPVPPQV